MSGALTKAEKPNARSPKKDFAVWTWMKKLGLVMNLTELGVTPDMIDGIASATLVMDGGYKVLSTDEIKEILKASL